MAPITAILIVFEMSGDYKLILPLMLSTVLSTLLAEHLFKHSIYTLKLKLKGINWQGGRDRDILQSVTVNEVMACENLVVTGMETPISQLIELFAKKHFNGVAVLDENDHLWGVATVTDVERAIEQGLP